MKLSETYIDYSLVKSFDEMMLKKYLLLPFKKDDFYLYVVTSNESDVTYLNHLMIKEVKAECNEVLFFLSHLHERIKLFEIAQQAVKNENHKQTFINEFMKQLLSLALSKRSSDIHFESTQEYLKIRFRIDGILKSFFVFEKTLYPIVSSVIKLYCSLDITQKRKPLNGRFSFKLNKKEIDFRVSTMPTICGESIVLRVLDEFKGCLGLENLGFSGLQLETLEKVIKKSNGLILITGPTGSGKTTTLYSILQQLNNEEKKIITIEEPIEYQLKNLQQIAVNNSIGLGFNEILKDILRQDPDIIMIGEIRDEITLQIAFQAAMTGHLVLSTLHTNDALSTLNRLYDLQAKPYIVADTLRSIISQRLVLKRCFCQSGCNKCNYTQFDGRVSLSEHLVISDEIASLISRGDPLELILKCAKDEGFQTIYEDAKNKIETSLTTQDEVYKVLGDIDEKI